MLPKGMFLFTGNFLEYEVVRAQQTNQTNVQIDAIFIEANIRFTFHFANDDLSRR
jgi:predicted LPLAT superfamily acyltransferase